MVSRRNVLAAGAGSMLALGMLPTMDGRQVQDLEGGTMIAGMTGGQEVPPVDTGAEGAAVFALGFDPSEVDTDDPDPEDATELHYSIVARSIEDVEQAHIHHGDVCEVGEVVAWLYPSPEITTPRQIEGRFSGVLAHGIITEDDLVGPMAGEDFSTLVEAMLAGETYANAHTEVNPGGEIRGHILQLNDIIDQVDEWTECPAETPTETETATESPTETPTETPTGTPEGTPTETPTGTPEGTPTETPTGTPEGTPTGTPTPTPGDE